MKTSSAAWVSAVIYTGLSALISAVFFILTLRGDYNWLTRVGGSVWIFLLCMIILMPTITPIIKRRSQL
jgi:hypothetical protein